MTFGMAAVPKIFVVVSAQVFVILAYNLQRIDYPRLELDLETYSNNHPDLASTKYADAIKIFTSKRNFTNDVLVYSINSGRSSSSGTEGTSGYAQDNSNDTTIEPLNSWSVVWYVGSFGGLIIFFLIVSCSEWCCRRHARNRCSSLNENSQTSPQIPDTPPPSYDQFAPPAYDSLVGGSRSGEKREYDIYVVPVHALGTIMESHHNQQVEVPRGRLGLQEDAPPSYLTASSGCMFPAFPVVSSVTSVPDNISRDNNTTSSSSTVQVTPVLVENHFSSFSGSNVAVPNVDILEPNTSLLETHTHGNNRSNADFDVSLITSNNVLAVR